MVAGKKIHCVSCNKKCSGNVLRYQDQYYHKQCFELEQAQSISTSVERQQQQRQDSSRSPEQFTYNVRDFDDDKIQQQHQKQSHVYKRQLGTTIGGSSAQLQQQSPAAVSFDRSTSQQQLVGSSQTRTATASTNGYPNYNSNMQHPQQQLSAQQRGQTIDARLHSGSSHGAGATGDSPAARSATLPHSVSSPANGFLDTRRQFADCAGCGRKINDGQALIALDLHWHVWCFKCTQCQTPLHGEYVAKDGKAYCEKDYQKLFGVSCIYCKRYITGKVLQAGEAHHFHPSCARCSKCGDPFVPGEEMYLQGEITWHPRCGPGPDSGPLGEETLIDASSRSQLRSSRPHSPSLSSRSRSRSASPFSFLSRQYGRSSPGYADSEAVGDLSRIYTISYLNADPTQGYLRRPIEPNPPKSPQFSRPTSSARDRSRSSSRSQCTAFGEAGGRERSIPRGMYSVLSSMKSGSSHRARSPSMMNEEAIHMAQYPSGQKPSPDTVPKIERDDFPAPPFPYPRAASSVGGAKNGKATGAGANNNGQSSETKVSSKHSGQQRASRPRSREIVLSSSTGEYDEDDDDDYYDENGDPQLRKEEKELSKIANGIGKIFLQTLKEREKLRAWKRANLDPRNASRTPSAQRELPSRMRYENPLNASPSRDMDRPRPWEDEEQEHSPTRTRSSLGRTATTSASAVGAASQMSASTYGYKVVQSNRFTPKPGYGVSSGPPYNSVSGTGGDTLVHGSDMSFSQQQRFTQNRSTDLLNRATLPSESSILASKQNHHHLNQQQRQQYQHFYEAGGVPHASRNGTASILSGGAHLRRSMPNVNLSHLHLDGPPKLYPYHLLATSNYRLPPDVDRCHLERHLSNEEFHYIFRCDRLDFYRLPEWKRNELKRRAKLF